MSNDKQCVKHCRLKFKVSKTRLIRFGWYKSVSKEKTKVHSDEKKWYKIFLIAFKWQNTIIIFILWLNKSFIVFSRNSL